MSRNLPKALYDPIPHHEPGAILTPSPTPPKYGFLKRNATDAELITVISILMNPPAQIPGANFIVIDLDWARSMIGASHFRPMGKLSMAELDKERFHSQGLRKTYRDSSGKCLLREKGLELGLPMVYWMALCGERKEGCYMDQLVCLKEEWEDGGETRWKQGVKWMRLA
ncbi:hypothetical protein CC86DRAFT_400660 [Ophiobolus disseminans]|uniref:Uncharacterized protein n=1 Tax=Ophiobolus disseminans TaxID=1469910 RepID=A0A6A7AH09_9PLEO|nr:hypothetical protein CC86DRAFT_400660 [Ophiobolus disseminans]